VNKDWDLADLRVFCSVARLSSFSAAATDLGISPAYVTKRIADFEKALGVTLFRRTTRQVRITEEGALAYLWARRVLDAAKNLTQEVAGAKHSPAGLLRISTSMRLGNQHLSHVLSLLQEQYPRLEVWLELLDRRVDLIGEAFDIDVRMAPVNEPHLFRHLITKNKRILCAAPAYLERRGRPQTLADLALHDCLLYRERHLTFGVWRMDGPNGPESVTVTGPMGANHSEAVRNWALAGRGIVMLSSWDVAPEFKQGKLERVLPAYSQVADVWAATATRLADSAKLKICVEFFVEHLTKGKYALDTSIT
jgi:LysR family transcriptional regulator, transcriptional activator for dmlA